MAVSQSYNFTLNRNKLIKRAMLLLGVISAQQTPTNAEYADGGEALNLMLKSWQADGLQLWRTEIESIVPTATNEYYFYGGGSSGAEGETPYAPVDVLEVYRKHTTDDIWVELNRLSRTDFYKLSDQDSTGVPVNFYYNNDFSGYVAGRTRESGTLRVWPVPNSDFISNYTLEVVHTVPFDDMNSGDDQLAFPRYWELAIVYGLAVLLAPEYGVELRDQQNVQMLAMQAKEAAMNWDTEHTSIFLTVDNNA